MEAPESVKLVETDRIRNDCPNMILYTKEIKFCSDNSGYVCFMDKEHPLSHKTGRTYYHRHIASIKYGRWLQPDEHVHHIDGNKKNNEPENLVVVTPEEHTVLHKGEILEKFCLNCSILFLPKANKIVYCSEKCFRLASIKNKELTKELLDSLIPTHTWVSLGKMFGYSDNGIKKRAKALGCIIPKRR